MQPFLMLGRRLNYVRLFFFLLITMHSTRYFIDSSDFDGGQFIPEYFTAGIRIEFVS